MTYYLLSHLLFLRLIFVCFILRYIACLVATHKPDPGRVRKEMEVSS